MADPGGQRFNIDSSMDVPADGFILDVDGSGPFLAAADGQEVTLEAGFLDPSDVPQTVRHIEGICDEWDLIVERDSITGSIRGRDKIHLLLDRPFEKLFLLDTPEVDPGVDFAVGTFLASEIAREIATTVGLTLSYQVRDYTMKEDFEATGRSLDIIRRLIEPFNLTEQFKTDVFVQGSTLFIRQRKETPPADVDASFSALDARIQRMTIRKRFAPRWGTITLLGLLEPRGVTEEVGVGGGIILVSGTVEEITSTETFDPSGKRVGLIVTTAIIRMPDRKELSNVTQKFILDGPPPGNTSLVQEDRIFNEYESVRLSRAGPLNQARQLTQVIESFGIPPKSIDPTQTFQLCERQETEWGYDELGFESAETKRIFKLRKDAVLGVEVDGTIIKGLGISETRREIITVRDVEFLKTQEITSIFEKDKDTQKLVLKSVTTATSAGLRPAGIRPPLPSGVGGGDSVPQEQIQLVETISTDPRAVDIRFSNKHMDADDLEFIMDKFRKSSGLFEYELIIDYVSMPWIRKSNVLEITGLLAEDGVTPIPLEPALVVEQNLDFDESGDSPQMVSTLRSLFWRST